MQNMTPENKKILDRINAYAETALADIDPQKTRISFQLEALKPVMEEIAAEKGVSVEDIFILYMDLASEASVEAENQLQATLDEDEAADFSGLPTVSAEKGCHSSRSSRYAVAAFSPYLIVSNPA